MQTVTASPPAIPTGQIRSFGAIGPKYEVCKALYPLQNGDWMVKIRLVESGEEAEYRYTHLLDDPEAQ
jgi:hypothetical protein